MSTENNKDFQWTDEAAKAFAKFAKKRSEEFPIELWDNEVLSMFKQDWEKRNAPIPEYEILSFRDPCSDAQHRIVAYQSPHLTREDWAKSWLRANAPIHSVRRLSDGEVFSVGDKIEGSDGGKHSILGIEIDQQYVGGLLLLTDENADFKSGVTLRYATKLPTPLFRTEDGVDIYKGTTFYEVSTERWDILAESEPHKPPYDQYYKYFSNKYNAERYVLMNKPTLSVNEVLDIFRDHEVFDELVSALHERAKAKL
jgi:hypothetical protein